MTDFAHSPEGAEHLEGPEPHEIDRLVRSHLDQAAERTDASRLVARVAAQLPASSAEAPLQPASSSRRTDGQGTVPIAPARNSARWFAWTVMTAAAVVVAFFGGRYLRPLTANAEGVLRGMQSVHSGEIDRCYRVQYAPDPRFWDGKNKLEGPSESVMWTRGDRFWSDCAIGELKLRIGCEEDGTLWVRNSAKKGIRFLNRRSQVPQEVALICAVNAMTVPSLVDDVLADFELQTARSGSSGQYATNLVWARLKPGRTHPMLSAALLEVDARTNVLVRLVLWMVRDGQPKGTVTYTLMDSGVQGDEQYRLKSHLDPDATIEFHRLGNTDAEAGAPREASDEISGTP